MQNRSWMSKIDCIEEIRREDLKITAKFQMGVWENCDSINYKGRRGGKLQIELWK